MSYRIAAACGSSIGRIRGNNEDNFYFGGQILPVKNQGQEPPLTLQSSTDSGIFLAVFDGMGGGDFGEEASYAAAACARQRLAQSRSVLRLEQLCQELNTAVCAAQTRLGTVRMGATLAAVYLLDDHITVCNIGDSPVFGLRDGQLKRISVDHTDEEFMRRQGITGRKPRLTQYLGMDPQTVLLEPFIAGAPVRPGDQYLICSDGLTDMLPPEELRRILMADRPVADSVQSLIAAAMERGGVDNTTVILLRICSENLPRREEHEQHEPSASVAGLGDRALSGLRNLWSGLRDSAKHFGNRNP